MASIPAPVPVPAGRSAGLAASTVGIARRGLLKFLRTPQLVVVGTIQSALFLLIFRYVFGGAIGAGGLDYVDFLVPGFITTGLLFAGMGAAAGVAEDLEQGFVDRLRSLPIPRSAVLAGRAMADTALLVWSLAITSAVGFAVGFRLHGGLADALAAFGLLLVFGFAFEWMFITLGLFAGTPQAAQGLALMVFPLTFVSSAYVPVESMPGWMQAFAEHQPVTVMVDAVRVLTQGPAAEALLGHGAGFYVTRALAWSAAILAVFVPLAVARYRRGGPTRRRGGAASPPPPRPPRAARRRASRLRAHLTPGTARISRTTARPARTTGRSSQPRPAPAPASGSPSAAGVGSGGWTGGLAGVSGPGGSGGGGGAGSAGGPPA